MWQALPALKTWGMTADIAERFESVMSESGEVTAAAALEQWYVSDDRRHRYYVSICSQYLDRQEAQHPLPTYRQLAPDFLDQVCLLPDGLPYPCADP